jgi:RecA-family ATPase
MIDFRSIDVAKRLAPLANTEIVSPADHKARYDEWRTRQDDGGIEMPWEKLSGRFELKPGTLTMLAGYSGHFKSTISAQMILSCMVQGKRVGLASLELELPQIMDQLMDIACTTGNPSDEWRNEFFEWTRGKLLVYDRVDAIKPEDATAMTFAFSDMCCDVVVIDALMMCGLDTEDYGAEKDFTQVIQAIAKSEQLAVLLVHHARKPHGHNGEKSPPGKYDAMGSSNLVNICNNVLMVWHDKEKYAAAQRGENPDDDKPCLVLTVSKHRGGKFEGGVGLWQHHHCRAFCSTSQRRLKPVELK